MGMQDVRKQFVRKIKSLGFLRKRQPSPLCDLPLELLEMVASSLQTSDLGMLRMTCKRMQEKTFSIFWKSALQSVKTDLSYANLGELEKIARDDQRRRYVNQMAFKAHEGWFGDLGGGYEWSPYRHESGHLVNLQDHPAVKQLGNILSQLVNCTSFEVFDHLTEMESGINDPRPTDSITILLEIVAKASLPVTVLTVNFADKENEISHDLDPRRLHIPDKDQFIAIGQHLTTMNLLYTLDHSIVREWTFNMILHAPKLRLLSIRNQDLKGDTELIHRLASADISWPQLEEFDLKSIPGSVEDLSFILQKVQHSLRVLRISLVRIDGDLEAVKQMFRSLGTSFPALDTVSFHGLLLGVRNRTDSIHFPIVSENPWVDKSEGRKFEYASISRGLRNHYVAYSGPKMDVALDILARTVTSSPRTREFAV